MGGGENGVEKAEDPTFGGLLVAIRVVNHGTSKKSGQLDSKAAINAKLTL